VGTDEYLEETLQSVNNTRNEWFIPHRSVPVHDQKCPHFPPERDNGKQGEHEDDDIGDKSTQ
jgi:hypothetical protein